MKTRIALIVLSLAAACSTQDEGVKIIAREMKFEPAEIHAARGKALHVALENKGTVLHDWNVAGLTAREAPSPHAHHSKHGHETGNTSPAGIHAMAEPGSTASLQFEPTEAGVYEFYCSVPGHREAGMKGRLIVH
jgi:uncharacterized cupredoxin-like copper-binding protein